MMIHQPLVQNKRFRVILAAGVIFFLIASYFNQVAVIDDFQEDNDHMNRKIQHCKHREHNQFCVYQEDYYCCFSPNPFDFIGECDFIKNSQCIQIDYDEEDDQMGHRNRQAQQKQTVALVFYVLSVSCLAGLILLYYNHRKNIQAQNEAVNYNQPITMNYPLNNQMNHQVEMREMNRDHQIL